MVDNKKTGLRMAALMVWTVALFIGCSTVNERIEAAKAVTAQYQEGREFRDITSAVEMPIEVSRFRNRFNALENQKLDLTVSHFQNLVEWALVLRHRTISFAEELKHKKDSGEPVSGEDLEVLSQGIKQHLAMREEIMSLVYTYKDVAMHNGNEPWLIDKEVHAKATMLALAAALVLYDNFAISVMSFQDDTFLRRLANRENKGFDIAPETLKKVLISYHSPEKRVQVRDALEWVQREKVWIQGLSKKDNDLAYLYELIESSPSMHLIRDDGRLSDYAKYIGLFAHRSVDRIQRVSEGSMNELSKGFGNTVGLVELRKGKLYGDAEVATELRKQLKPMDILLEKTPFRLTDKFIPGHFGHVAIWVGTAEELQAMNLWEHPLIKPHQQAISEGKHVLEALRNGVVLSSLEHFMNVDDVAILRLRATRPELIQEMVIRSFRQVGKEYDFNFDVETLDKIVCSELVYAVYTHLTWPTEKTIGRATISPDNVAVMALDDKPLELVLFYHDGENLQAEAFETYKQLLSNEK